MTFPDICKIYGISLIESKNCISAYPPIGYIFAGNLRHSADSVIYSTVEEAYDYLEKQIGSCILPCEDPNCEYCN